MPCSSPIPASCSKICAGCFSCGLPITTRLPGGSPPARGRSGLRRAKSTKEIGHQAAGSRNGLPQRTRDLRPVTKTPSSYCQGKCVRRCMSAQGARHRQQRRRIQMVRFRRSDGWCDRKNANGSRIVAHACIHKNHQIRTCQVRCHFRRKLLRRHNPQAGGGKSCSAASAICRPTPSSSRSELPHASSSAGELAAPPLGTLGTAADAGGGGVLVVNASMAPRPQPLRTSRTRLPSGARSSTASGIRPIACVEQLRHGSNVRTTASTRFSMPSAMCSPCT